MELITPDHCTLNDGTTLTSTVECRIGYGDRTNNVRAMIFDLEGSRVAFSGITSDDDPSKFTVYLIQFNKEKPINDNRMPLGYCRRDSYQAFKCSIMVRGIQMELTCR